MSPDQWIVTATGAGLIVFIAWFFWFAPRNGARARHDHGAQEALIVVKGGYTPDTVIVKSGKPVRLYFRREETASCSEMVLFPDFGITAALPQGEAVPIDLLPTEAGTFEFACQMGMLRGRLVVESSIETPTVNET